VCTPIRLGSRWWLAVLSCAWLIGACSSPPAPTPITDSPKITCPPSRTVEAPAPAIVTYVSPTVAGGLAPITIACTPPSGSTFSLGVTNVTCTALDAQRRSDSCALTVTVTPPPRISATRFVAFGDSITEGKFGPADYTGDPQFPDAYARVLYQLLRDRYTAQDIFMFDRGFGGEQVVPNGTLRLPGVLTTDSPQVLLLLEGVNDLISGRPIAAVVEGLRTMIREAKGRGIVVFIGTLLPERPGGLRAGHPELIVPANDEIRRLAVAEGATLVDLYQAFGGTPDPLIDADGLHPNAMGYQKMGETFFAAIRSTLEPGTITSR
jgi:lysophospholipase L1-like esterase